MKSRRKRERHQTPGSSYGLNCTTSSPSHSLICCTRACPGSSSLSAHTWAASRIDPKASAQRAIKREWQRMRLT